MKRSTGMTNLLWQMKEHVLDPQQTLHLQALPPSPVTWEMSAASCPRSFLHLLAVHLQLQGLVFL